MNENTKKLVGMGLLTAVVVVLQLLGSFIHFGIFSISLVLIPIVVGSALYGKGAGAWLGLVFGIVVLLQPDTAFFYNFSVTGTVITVVLKGTLAGFLSGLVYNICRKKNKYFAVIVSAVVCPLVNTCVFILGCFVFFMNDLTQMADGQNLFSFIILTFVGWNFLFELATNMILSPVAVRIINIGKKEIK